MKFNENEPCVLVESRLNNIFKNARSVAYASKSKRTISNTHGYGSYRYGITEISAKSTQKDIE